MIYTGKVQLTVVIKSSPELEAEGDRIFESHAAWLESTHYQEGDKALLQYNVSKSSDENGNPIYVLTEVYESNAGIDDHMERDDWDLGNDFSKWLDQNDVTFIRSAPIIHSLW